VSKVEGSGIFLRARGAVVTERVWVVVYLVRSLPIELGMALADVLVHCGTLCEMWAARRAGTQSDREREGVVEDV
jgi:hypothetical protein